MAIDSAQDRRSVAGLPYFIFGPGVTPDATPGIEWRQEAGWGYSGIAAAEPVPDSGGGTKGSVRSGLVRQNGVRGSNLRLSGIR